MKNFILIGCLIGGIVAYSGNLAPIASSYKQAMVTNAVEAPSSVQSVHEIEIASMPPATVANTTYSEEATKVKEAVKPSFKLQSVNDITLFDDPSAVIKKLGKPEQIVEDPYLNELYTYQYPNMAIVFSDGMLYSLEIPENAQTIIIDGIQLAATIKALEEALGQPDYETEDGIVFERGDALLKLFIDVDSNKLTSIHYFHRASM
ncbi:hypothetical protein AB4Z29_24190 [Paenibacillus sp. 2TAB23]|uniref:hypothetical protein n=1 Tax=Paenibacillus sp. 2TAB23 TaxID=3233004 RepID=UPI003F9AE1E7